MRKLGKDPYLPIPRSIQTKLTNFRRKAAYKKLVPYIRNVDELWGVEVDGVELDWMRGFETDDVPITEGEGPEEYRAISGEVERGAKDGRSEATTVYYCSKTTNNILLVASLLAQQSCRMMNQSCRSTLWGRLGASSMS